MEKPVILVADDNESYRSTVVEFLKLKGFIVCEASNTSQARSILEKEEVDIALIDIRMQDQDDPTDISGIELAANTDPLLKKILCTAYPDPIFVLNSIKRIGGKHQSVIDLIDKAEGLAALVDLIIKKLQLVDIFIVHGHDEKALLDVKLFISQLNLKPIILSEQPSSGSLIFEKLEQNSNNKYAIMLYTPDDFGFSDKDSKNKEDRARQNVVLETGFFMGKLGRENICILKKDNVILPSDIHGIVYIMMDPQGAWKIPLARELQKAGININMNLIL